MSAKKWILVAFIVLALTPFWRRLWDEGRAELLRRHGKPTKAAVIRLEETGKRYREGPVVILHVDFSIPEHGKVKASVRGMLTFVQLQSVRPGVEIDIAYDPKNPSRIAFVGTPDQLSTEN